MGLSFKPIIEDLRARLSRRRFLALTFRILPGEQRKETERESAFSRFSLILSRFSEGPFRCLHTPFLVCRPLVDSGLPKISGHEARRV